MIRTALALSAVVALASANKKVKVCFIDSCASNKFDGLSAVGAKTAYGIAKTGIKVGLGTVTSVPALKDLSVSGNDAKGCISIDLGPAAKDCSIVEDNADAIKVATAGQVDLKCKSHGAYATRGECVGEYGGG